MRKWKQTQRFLPRNGLRNWVTRSCSKNIEENYELSTYTKLLIQISVSFKTNNVLHMLCTLNLDNSWDGEADGNLVLNSKFSKAKNKKCWVQNSIGYNFFNLLKRFGKAGSPRRIPAQRYMTQCNMIETSAVNKQQSNRKRIYTIVKKTGNENKKKKDRANLKTYRAAALKSSIEMKQTKEVALHKLLAMWRCRIKLSTPLLREFECTCHFHHL